MARLDVAGGALHYERWGEGPAVVFAHGAGGNRLSWWQQVPALRGRFTCIAFDHRGFGQTPDPEGNGSKHFVDDLERLIEAEAPGQRIALVAQSMGGWTCLGYARRRPDRVAALVMCDTPGGVVGPGMADEQTHWRAARRPPDGHNPYIGTALSHGYGERDSAGAYLYGMVAGLNERQFLRRDLGPFLATIHRCGPEDLAALSVPVLWMAGSEDDLVSPALIRMLAGWLPGSRYEEVPDAGHSVYWERPDLFNEMVAAFIMEHTDRQ